MFQEPTRVVYWEQDEKIEGLCGFGHQRMAGGDT